MTSLQMSGKVWQSPKVLRMLILDVTQDFFNFFSHFGLCHPVHKGDMESFEVRDILKKISSTFQSALYMLMN